MNETPTNPNDDFLITFADIVQILKKNSRTIKFGTLLVATLALIFGLIRPPQYLAEASFKEKGKSDSGIGKSFISQLVGGDSSDSDAVTMMKSRNLMEKLIQKQGLQAIISQKDTSFPLIPFASIKNNLLTEYALLMNLRHPILKDPKIDITPHEVVYQGETPIEFKLIIADNNQYHVYDNNKASIGTGNFGKPFISDQFSITLNVPHETIHPGSEYFLTLLPLGTTALNMAKQFVVETDKEYKGVVKMNYKHSDRHQAAAILAALMETYQEHLRNEHERLCCLQVDYLVHRQKEMAKQLSDVMDRHAESISTDLYNTGFTTSERAMEFLAGNQQQLKQKLLGIDLDIQRLQQISQADHIDYEKFTSASIPEPLSRLTAEMRGLKQQSDGLNITLRNSPINSDAFQDSFKDQIDELDTVKTALAASQTMMTALQNNTLPSPAESLLSNPKFIVKMWYDRAATSFDPGKGTKNNSTEWLKNRDGFSAYLSHLIHYLYIYQRTIEERLAHQQSPRDDFQGVNLGTAREIYINYSKELSDTEAEMIQKRFLAGQINDPNFEISSLSSVLNDPISNEMISKATAIVLALKDFENRSPKEQDRLKADLAIQEGFLKTHLEQSVQLLELRQQFLKDKLLSLQNITLSLVQEQISLLEDQIRKYIVNAIDNLNQEKKLIQNNLKELRIEMATFPQKWAAEKQIEQQMNVNKTMVEEITKLVESKNISNNLEKIQSAPIDLPLVPLHPKSPKLLLLTIMGAFLGLFMSSTWVLARSIGAGIPVSQENLRTAGLHVAGKLSAKADGSGDLLDSDLDTLRRLTSHLTNGSKAEGQSLLLLKGAGIDYSKTLAALMTKTGLKTVVVDLTFESSSEKAPGMLQFLESGQQPSIQHTQNFDFISSGGISRYDNELITSLKCREFIHALQKNYDWVIAMSKGSPETAEGESLLDLFSATAVSITGETWDNLRPLIINSRKEGKKVSFIFTAPQSKWRH